MQPDSTLKVTAIFIHYDRLSAYVQCPYCGEVIWMEFYPEEGNNQEMVVDCEVCCNPILYSIRFNSQGEARLTVDRAQ